eukprot:TRINITY_DN17267_c0_g1_i4.p1 TRINITY_DN17267_c0_g1~~TRINITY_DN17267_c0_g1_i4.p1  ORF type:complete len:289 (-),score=28.05 TRINITY_DN17267_c0_g1_i4:140-1006(-)
MRLVRSTGHLIRGIRGCSASASLPPPFVLPKGAITQFETDGYIAVNGILNSQEAVKIGEAHGSSHKCEQARRLIDNLRHSERVGGGAAQLLDGPVHHLEHPLAHRTKPSLWRQDYSRWYYTGVLRPLMLRVHIGLAPMTRLRILKFSHKVGRLDLLHPRQLLQGRLDPQRLSEPPLRLGERVECLALDQQRVQVLIKSGRVEEIELELPQGKAAFMDANLIWRYEECGEALATQFARADNLPGAEKLVELLSGCPLFDPALPQPFERTAIWKEGFSHGLVFQGQLQDS